MWSFIERAYTGFSEDERKRLEQAVPYGGKDPKFIGFDGNNEGEYMSIAKFLVDEMDRFQDFKGYSMNSHCRKVSGYYRMVQLAGPMRINLTGRELSVDDVVKLLSAEA